MGQVPRPVMQERQVAVPRVQTQVVDRTVEVPQVVQVQKVMQQPIVQQLAPQYVQEQAVMTGTVAAPVQMAAPVAAMPATTTVGGYGGYGGLTGSIRGF